MERQIIRILSVTILAWLSLATLVYALDEKVMPGSACLPERSGLEEGEFGPTTGFVIPEDGRSILNLGGGEPRVHCPIVRDNVTNTTGITVFVRVSYVQVDEPLTCTLFSFGRFGEKQDSDSASTRSNEPVTLRLKVKKSMSGGYYTLNCTLPHGSEVFSYRVAE